MRSFRQGTTQNTEQGTKIKTKVFWGQRFFCQKKNTARRATKMAKEFVPAQSCQPQPHNLQFLAGVAASLVDKSCHFPCTTTHSWSCHLLDGWLELPPLFWVSNYLLTWLEMPDSLEIMVASWSWQLSLRYQTRISTSLKGSGSPDQNFFEPIKLNQYFLCMRNCCFF